jgi:hypothetical protein
MRTHDIASRVTNATRDFNQILEETDISLDARHPAQVRTICQCRPVMLLLHAKGVCQRFVLRRLSGCRVIGYS